MTDRPAYLITGATGFLGRHVLQNLRQQTPDARIFVLVRKRSTWDALPWRTEAGAVEIIEGPLFPSDGWQTDPRLAGLTGIFHLAGEVKHSRSDAGEMFRTNVDGTAAMVRLAAGQKCRLLLASTSGTVGCSEEAGPGADEEAAYCETVVRGWPYYVSKIRAELIARRLARELAVTLIIFRPPVMLGPGDHKFRSTSNVLRVLRRKLPFIFRGSIHYADVRDVAAAMVRAMLLPDPRPIYHTVGTVQSLDDFFGLVAAEAGLPRSWKVLPTPLVGAVARLGERLGIKSHVVPNPVLIEMASHHWELASRYAEADLGYKVRPPGETIADTVRWLRENHPELKSNSNR